MRVLLWFYVQLMNETQRGKRREYKIRNCEDYFKTKGGRSMENVLLFPYFALLASNGRRQGRGPSHKISQSGRWGVRWLTRGRVCQSCLTEARLPEPPGLGRGSTGVWVAVSLADDKTDTLHGRKERDRNKISSGWDS